MELLLEVDRTQWIQLRDLYREDWPKNVVASCILDANILYPDLSEMFHFKIYCPEGDINNGMVAISGDASDFIRVHPLNGIDKMEEALATTKVIDWNRSINVVFANSEADECFKRLSGRLGLKINGTKAFKHVLHRESSLVDDMSPPPNTYVAEPKPEHLDIIDKSWRFHGNDTLKYFQALVKNHLLFALYSDDGNLLSWVAVGYEGILTHLFCLEEHRRKGYAEYILRYVVNHELKNKKDLCAFTFEHNLKPQKLFDKLNFERPGWDRWLSIQKIKE